MVVGWTFYWKSNPLMHRNFFFFFLMLLWKPTLRRKDVVLSCRDGQLGTAGALEGSGKEPGETHWCFQVWRGDLSSQLRVNIENCCRAWLELHHKRATRGRKSSAPSWENVWDVGKGPRCRAGPAVAARAALLCRLHGASPTGRDLVEFSKCCC